MGKETRAPKTLLDIIGLLRHESGIALPIALIMLALLTSVTLGFLALTASVVLRLRRASIEQMEVAEPELAAALHRWLAETLAERLTDALRAFDALLQ